MSVDASPCPLCAGDGGTVLWRDAACRVVRVEGDEGLAFAGFCRVIWRSHVAEMSDLPPPDRVHLMQVVDAVERVLRRHLVPDKINLASLGNVVPHLHWHVIPRWRDDSHFPAPIWAAPSRPALSRSRPDDAMLKADLAAILGKAVAD